MKKFFLLIGVAALLATVSAVRATPTLLIGSLVTVNNTTSNSPVVQALGNITASQTITITHGALTATNAFYIAGQFTVDQTNYYTSPVVWYPSYTNATTEYVNANYFTFTPYFRAQITSTNSVQVGGSYGN
jgi:hypothetical protein